MSTLTVIFVVPILPTPSPSATPTPSPEPTATPLAWSAGDQANQAAGSLAEVGKAAATVAIWIGILLLPVALALIILLLLSGFRLPPVRPVSQALAAHGCGRATQVRTATGADRPQSADTGHAQPASRGSAQVVIDAHAGGRLRGGCPCRPSRVSPGTVGPGGRLNVPDRAVDQPRVAVFRSTS